MRAVALKTIYFTDEKTGQRKKALARGNGHHGVFSGLTSEQFDKLEALQAVRKPTKGEIAEAGEDSESDRVVVLEEAPTSRKAPAKKDESKPAAEVKTDAAKDESKPAAEVKTDAAKDNLVG